MQQGELGWNAEGEEADGQRGDHDPRYTGQ
jgi:hypothetical protein